MRLFTVNHLDPLNYICPKDMTTIVEAEATGMHTGHFVLNVD